MTFLSGHRHGLVQERGGISWGVEICYAKLSLTALLHTTTQSETKTHTFASCTHILHTYPRHRPGLLHLPALLCHASLYTASASACSTHRLLACSLSCFPLVFRRRGYHSFLFLSWLSEFDFGFYISSTYLSFYLILSNDAMVWYGMDYV